MSIVWMLPLLAVVAVAQNPQYTILSYLNKPNIDGSYRYSYKTDNGISVEEDGFLKNQGQEGLEAQTARGSYSWTAPDGQVYAVTWFADETGFHAQGAHLPSSIPPQPTIPPPLVAGGRPGFGAPGGFSGASSSFAGFSHVATVFSGGSFSAFDLAFPRG